MMKFFKKKKHIDYSAENLAVPEVFVDDDEKKTESINDTDSDEDKSEVVFDNLAVPEINIKRRKHKT